LKEKLINFLGVFEIYESKYNRPITLTTIITQPLDYFTTN